MKYYLYTDGSANNFSPYGEGGYAYIIANQEKQVISQFSKGELYTTNSAMELKAIIKGCKSIKEDNINIVVISDSQYAINVLSGKWKAKTNLDLIQEHLENVQRLNIEYKWVKGHSGERLNEMADKLANNETLRLKKLYGIPSFDYKNSPKAQSKKTKTIKKKVKIKPPPQCFYVHVEVALKGDKAFGAYSIFDSMCKEFKTDVQEYWCHTEPRLRLMTLSQALSNIPAKANVIITSVNSYIQFALSNNTLKPDAYNTDIIKVLREKSHNLSKIEFKSIAQTLQEHKALEALCSYISHVK